MTLWISQDGQKVAIHGNINLDVAIEGSRVREYVITEDVSQLRSFWSQLGSALDQAEHVSEQAEV